MFQDSDPSDQSLNHLGRLIKIAENSLGVIAVLRRENSRLREELRLLQAQSEFDSVIDGTAANHAVGARI